MNDAWRVASITTFEEVPVGNAISLLRVVAASSVAAHADDPRPLLVVDEREQASAFAALPAPLDADGTLRCAYSVPADALGPDSSFSLEFEDGLVIALPRPESATPHVQKRVVPRQILELVRDVAEARAELQAMRDLQAARPAAARTAPAPTTAAVDPDVDARLEELEIWNGELERRLAQASNELADAQAELAQARERASATPARVGALAPAQREHIVAGAVQEAERQAAQDLADAAD